MVHMNGRPRGLHSIELRALDEGISDGRIAKCRGYELRLSKIVVLICSELRLDERYPAFLAFKLISRSTMSATEDTMLKPCKPSLRRPKCSSSE